MNSRRLIQNGKSGSAQPLLAGRLNIFRPWKENYVRNRHRGIARSDVARRTPDLAAQPELGVRTDRRIGLGSSHSGCPAFAAQDLSRRGAKSDAPCVIGAPYRVPRALFGYDSRAERLCTGREEYLWIEDNGMQYRQLISHKPLAITVLAITAFAMGCKPSAEQNEKNYYANKIRKHRPTAQEGEFHE
jgi:hypothetical protein